MVISKNKKRDMVPIRCVFWFNIATFLLFIVGPWNYIVDNYVQIGLVVLSCNTALYFGYSYAIKKYRSRNRKDLASQEVQAAVQRNDTHVLFLLKRWTIVAAIMALPDTLYYARVWTLSLNQIWQRLILGLTSSASNYSASLSYQGSGSLVEKIVVLATVLLYFFKFGSIVLNIIHWRKIPGFQKLLCSYIIVMECLKWLLKGMNKGLFDIVFIFLGAVIIKIYMDFERKDFLNAKILAWKKRQKNKLLLGVFILAIAAVVVFVMNNNSRSSGSNLSLYSTSMKLYADDNNFLLQFFPPGLQSSFLAISMYLTNGYQGLSYALKLPFEWCYGIGNNQFLISNVRDVLGFDVTSSSYLTRVEELFPWSAEHNWHTLYTWLANDISFYLLPIAFFIFGLLFAYSWKHAVERRNPYATVVFCLFVIRFAYTSANNQVTSSSFSFVAWFIALALWWVTCHKYSLFYSKNIKTALYETSRDEDVSVEQEGNQA